MLPNETGKGASVKVGWLHYMWSEPVSVGHVSHVLRVEKGHNRDKTRFFRQCLISHDTYHDLPTVSIVFYSQPSLMMIAVMLQHGLVVGVLLAST